MKYRLTALVTAMLLLLGGCTLPAEERAFAVALGISAKGDIWEVSARIPNYQQGGGYLTLSARGTSLGEAMALLNATAPMEMHFGQLRMVIFSKELAESSSFPAVVDLLSQRTEVRGQASLCVTEDSLSDVMDALEPLTGSRLSKSLETLLETRYQLGAIPMAQLAEVRRTGQRQQPVLICLALQNDPANTVPGMDTAAGDQAAKGAGQVQLAGSYLVGREGAVRGSLTTMEQQLLSLLMGDFRRGALSLPETTVTLLDASSRVRLSGDQVDCHIRIRYSASGETEAGLADMLTQALESLTTKLTRAGCDALGLGRQAIARYATMAAWHGADWPSQYPTLKWNIQVDVQRET